MLDYCDLIVEDFDAYTATRRYRFKPISMNNQPQPISLLERRFFDLTFFSGWYKIDRPVSEAVQNQQKKILQHLSERVQRLRSFSTEPEVIIPNSYSGREVQLTKIHELGSWKIRDE